MNPSRDNIFNNQQHVNNSNNFQNGSSNSNNANVNHHQITPLAATSNNVNLMQTHSLNSLFGIRPELSNSMMNSSSSTTSNNNHDSFMQSSSHSNFLHMLNQQNMYPNLDDLPNNMNIVTTQNRQISHPHQVTITSSNHLAEKSQNNHQHNTYSNVSFSTSSLSTNINQPTQPTTTGTIQQHQNLGQQHNNLQEIQEKLLKELSPEQLFQLYMVLEKLPIPSNQQPPQQTVNHVQSTSHTLLPNQVVTPQHKQTISIGHTSSSAMEDDFTLHTPTTHESVSRLLLDALQNQHEITSNRVLFNSSSTHVHPENSNNLNLSNNITSSAAQGIAYHQEQLNNSLSQSHAPSSSSMDEFMNKQIHVNQSISPVSSSNNLLSIVTKGVATRHHSASMASSSDSSSSSKREELTNLTSSRGIKKISKQERHKASPESALAACNFSVHTLESFKTEQMRIQSLPKRPRGRPRKPGSTPRRRKKPQQLQSKEEEKKQSDDDSNDSSSGESSASDSGSSDQSTNAAEPNH